MSYMASIYGIAGMSEYLKELAQDDADYRRALDDRASSIPAPNKIEYRRFLYLTRNRMYAKKLPKIVAKFGSRPPIIMHLLAHTDYLWSSKALTKLIEIYNKHGIAIDPDLKYAIFKAKELRLLVKDKHSTLHESVKKAEAAAEARKVPVKIDLSLLKEFAESDEYSEYSDDDLWSFVENEDDDDA